eukprot:jgi/Botrbrau1/3818/Bobra.0183s0048.1
MNSLTSMKGSIKTTFTGSNLGGRAAIKAAVRPRTTIVRAAKRLKAPKTPSSSQPSTKVKEAKTREGTAYQEETRKVIMEMKIERKVTPIGKEILKNVGLSIYLGAKIGILGANGAGKSSLMRILAGVDHNYNGTVKLVDPGAEVVWGSEGGKGPEHSGEYRGVRRGGRCRKKFQNLVVEAERGLGAGPRPQAPDNKYADDKYDGTVKLVDGVRVAYLEQEPQLQEGATVEENIRPALARMQALLHEFNEVSTKMAEGNGDVESLMSRMDRLQTEIDAANGWEIDRILQQASEALRCPPGDAEVVHLSGGEARRVALCRILLQAPDILLLDEPTNHLDCASVAWLERTLANFKGTVIAITHDRFFLDNVAGWILELDQGKGLPFQGNYSEWLEAKEKRISAEKREQLALQRSLKEELEWVRSKAQGQMKKGKARMRRYEDLLSKAGDYTRTAKLDTITIPVGPRLGTKVVEARGLTKGYGDRILMENLSFSIPPASIVGIIGGNGAGKSTLFRMITGEEKVGFIIAMVSRTLPISSPHVITISPT